MIYPGSSCSWISPQEASSTSTLFLSLPSTADDVNSKGGFLLVESWETLSPTSLSWLTSSMFYAMVFFWLVGELEAWSIGPLRLIAGSIKGLSCKNQVSVFAKKILRLKGQRKEDLPFAHMHLYLNYHFHWKQVFWLSWSCFRLCLGWPFSPSFLWEYGPPLD